MYLMNILEVDYIVEALLNPIVELILYTLQDSSTEVSCSRF